MNFTYFTYWKWHNMQEKAGLFTFSKTLLFYTLTTPLGGVVKWKLLLLFICGELAIQESMLLRSSGYVRTEQ
jgi:hypothetical protein